MPPELKAIDQWVAWRYERRADGTGEAKVTKVPVNPATGTNAKTNDKTTWGTFEQAWARYERDGLDGVGLVLTLEVGIVGIDVDHCRIPETGAIEDEALAIVREIDSYTEISPSGTGIRIFARGKLPKEGRKKGRIEIYVEGRYLTVTGSQSGGPVKAVEERTEAIARLHARVFAQDASPGRERVPRGDEGETVRPEAARQSADDVIARLRSGRSAARFAALYDRGDWQGQGYASQSEADLALCSMMCARCGGDTGCVDALFRQSALMRAKWDERHFADGRTYGQETLRKAGARHASRGAVPPSMSTVGGLPGDGRPLMCTDTGNAERFVRRFGEQIRYCHPWKKHVFWDRKRWRIDDCGIAMRFSKDVVRGIYREAANCGNSKTREELIAWGTNSEKVERRKALVELAKSEPSIVVVPDQLDRDAWLLNCLNGTVDLRTGTRREHRRGDNITKLCPVEYDPNADAPIWKAFLARVLPDADVRDFVQRAVGWSITGDVSEQVLFFLFGAGMNGKSVFLSALLRLLGIDYAIQAAPDLVLSRKFASHPTDKADLFGKRLVATVEVGEGQAFDEVLIKQLTGSDRIRARRMREDHWEFDPTHHLWIAGNHKPGVRGTDYAIWRRILLVPFTVTIPKHERDRKLFEKLVAEFPGILAWAIHGCREWLERGLDPPEAVLLATEQYRTEMNVVGRFLEQCCVRRPRARAGASELFQAFLRWCAEVGEEPQSQTKFGDSMTEIGIAKRKIGGLMWYLDVALAGPSRPVGEGWGGSGPDSDINAFGVPREEVMPEEGPNRPQPSPGATNEAAL